MLGRRASSAVQRDLFPESAPQALRVFHGTYNDFRPEEMAPWSHFGTREAAKQRLRAVDGERGVREFLGKQTGSRARVIPMEITGRRINVGDELPTQFSSSRDIAELLRRGGHIDEAEYTWALEPLESGASKYLGRNAESVVAERLRDLAAKHDIGAIGYRNAVEDAGSISYLVPDPSTSVRPASGLRDALRVRLTRQ